MKSVKSTRVRVGRVRMGAIVVDGKFQNQCRSERVISTSAGWSIVCQQRSLRLQRRRCLAIDKIARDSTRHVRPTPYAVLVHPARLHMSSSDIIPGVWAFLCLRSA
jgi:hypothetical protein